MHNTRTRTRNPSFLVKPDPNLTRSQKALLVKPWSGYQKIHLFYYPDPSLILPTRTKLCPSLLFLSTNILELFRTDGRWTSPQKKKVEWLVRWNGLLKPSSLMVINRAATHRAIIRRPLMWKPWEIQNGTFVAHNSRAQFWILISVLILLEWKYFSVS